MDIKFAAHALPKTGALVAAVTSGSKMSPIAADLDKKTGGAVKRAFASSRFSGALGEFLDIVAPANLGNSRIVLIGIGDPAKLTLSNIEDLGGKIYARLAASGEESAVVMVQDYPKITATSGDRAAHAAYGARLRSYRFTKYKTKQKASSQPSLKKLTFQVDGLAAARRTYRRLEKIADGVFHTRDLVSEPANILFPKSFVQEARKLSKLGLKIQALGEKEMARLGMGALLGVGQGSARESQLLIMRWDGDPKARGEKKKPLAIVGKGVTFDTGGISIKPAPGMEDMKWDMGGAGTVFGLMAALAGRKAKVNVVGMCGLVENMPGSNAQRPGDVVTSMSGQTIEVLNTDAEGRLVLADALWYMQEKFKPKAIVDLATLTGAIIISLGHENAGLFSNNDDLSDALISAGRAVGEGVWRQPLGPEYDKLIDSPIADMKNIGGGRAGGSITAAQFLQRFIQDDTPWAHLDIAGMAWSNKERATVPKGGTGFGVRLLDRWIADNYE
ncbi:MAG: leucyl aminopeptidase [Pseudomonadota bacterium]